VTDSDLFILPLYTSIPAVREALHDTDIRRGAQHVHPEEWGVRDLFPVAMDQLSIPLPSTAVASAVLVFDDLARRSLSGAAAPQWVVQRVRDVVWRCNDWPEVLDLPLGRLYRALDDRWLVDEIVPKAELGLLVRRACVQLRAIGRRGSECP
jgi:hypothetical protein